MWRAGERMIDKQHNRPREKKVGSTTNVIIVERYHHLLTKTTRCILSRFYQVQNPNWFMGIWLRVIWYFSSLKFYELLLIFENIPIKHNTTSTTSYLRNPLLKISRMMKKKRLIDVIIGSFVRLIDQQDNQADDRDVLLGMLEVYSIFLRLLSLTDRPINQHWI